MGFFRDTSFGVHFLDNDADAGAYLPNGCQPITKQEADTLTQPTPAQIAAARKAEILTLLQGLDLKSVRPLREGNNSLVAQLEAQAAVLRIELSELPV